MPDFFPQGSYFYSAVSPFRAAEDKLGDWNVKAIDMHSNESSVQCLAPSLELAHRTHAHIVASLLSANGCLRLPFARQLPARGARLPPPPIPNGCP